MKKTINQASFEGIYYRIKKKRLLKKIGWDFSTEGKRGKIKPPNNPSVPKEE